MTCFVQYAPYEPREGVGTVARAKLWATGSWTRSTSTPNLGDSVIERQVLTPYDLEQRFGLIGGNIFQGEMSLDQLSLSVPRSSQDTRRPFKASTSAAQAPTPAAGSWASLASMPRRW